MFADLLDTPPGTTYVLKQISGTGHGQDLPGSGPLTGRRAPELHLADGSTLAGQGVTGQALLVRPGGAPDPAAEPWADRLVLLDGPADLLVRPDGIVAWAGDGDLAGALSTWLGPPRPVATSGP